MIRKAEQNDRPMLAELACQLWPHHAMEEMLSDLDEIMARPDAAFFIASEENVAVGFANASCGMTM